MDVLLSSPYLSADHKNLFFDHAKKQFSRLQGLLLILRSCSISSLYSASNLLTFQTCQCTQTHIYDCLCLYIGKSETFHQLCFCDLDILRASDDMDYFIDII